ncbi:MAG: hypothetical protein IPK70_12035 [Flavobacteriales bacterium]|nr:hypothetical protein [Flavobacteriales bacterium]
MRPPMIALGWSSELISLRAISAMMPIAPATAKTSVGKSGSVSCVSNCR